MFRGFRQRQVSFAEVALNPVPGVDPAPEGEAEVYTDLNGPGKSPGLAGRGAAARCWAKTLPALPGKLGGSSGEGSTCWGGKCKGKKTGAKFREQIFPPVVVIRFFSIPRAGTVVLLNCMQAGPGRPERKQVPVIHPGKKAFLGCGRDARRGSLMHASVGFAYRHFQRALGLPLRRQLSKSCTAGFA